ncbi:MAG TPA: hypothetical protein PKN32_00575 [Bacteroidales bacterium]|nr:hypothetical protein [Bacteroidales bacterium]
MKTGVSSILFFLMVCITLMFVGVSCNQFEVNYHELKALEGKWKVTKHRYCFYLGQAGELICDTTLTNTGIFEFHQTDDSGGTFTFTSTVERIPVTGNYSIVSYSGIYTLTDLQTSVDITLYPEGGGMPLKDVQVVDFGKKEQVWYADYSLNFESGANETLYLEKTK